MQLSEGLREIDFAPGMVARVELAFDEEAVSMRFVTVKEDDACDVSLDWIEEIKALPGLLDQAMAAPGTAHRVYPGENRSELIRFWPKNDGILEINFMNGYQFVRIELEPALADQFMLVLRRLLDEPGEAVIKK